MLCSDVIIWTYNVKISGVLNILRSCSWNPRNAENVVNIWYCDIYYVYGTRETFF